MIWVPDVEMKENHYGFVVGLPRSRDRYDSIWANYGQVNQISSFLKATYSVAKLYINHIVCLYGVPISINFDRGSVLPFDFGRSRRKQWAPDLIS